jgi:trk system potassium uptake protein TrkH
MPQHTINEPAIWHGEQRSFLSDREMRQIALFAFVYISLLVVGTGITAAHGYGLAESLFEYASALGTVGLSVGITAPDLPVSLLWAQTLGMFLGRLEILPVMIGVLKLLSDSRAMFGTEENGNHH